MTSWPLAVAKGARVSACGATAGTTLGTTLTAAGSANTKGSYSQLIASTPFTATGVMVSIFRMSANSGRFLVDIAIGAAASEVIILSDLSVGGAGSNGLFNNHVWIPLAIPAGSRIAARASCSTASRTIQAMVHLTGQGLMPGAPCQKAKHYGADTANTRLTQVDPGTTVNTKGSYVQLVASTDFHGSWLFLDTGSFGGATTDLFWLADFAIGAGGSETIIIPNMNFSCETAVDGAGAWWYAFPCSIPAGSRIACRCQCSVNTATERILDASVLILG